LKSKSQENIVENKSNEDSNEDSKSSTSPTISENAGSLNSKENDGNAKEIKIPAGIKANDEEKEEKPIDNRKLPPELHDHSKDKKRTWKEFFRDRK